MRSPRTGGTMAVEDTTMLKTGGSWAWWGMAMSTLAVAVLLAGSTAMSARQADQAELLMQAARNKQVVEGRLDEAIKIYQDVLAKYGGNRPMAARALAALGQCYEKLGAAQTAEARKAYERIVREFADQTAVAAEARTRLAALAVAGGGPAGATMTVRRVWSGPEVEIMGRVSSDGRFLSFTDWETGDLAIHDFATGQNRRLTDKGTWANSEEFAEYSVFSPDGRQIAYNWYRVDGSYDVRIIALDGSKPRVLRTARANDYYLFPMAWSPDGKHLLTQFLKADGSRDMMLVAVADGSTRLLKAVARDDRSPGGAFSPDGRCIAWAVKDGLALVDLGTGTEHPLIRDLTQPDVMDWTPDGRHLLFSSSRSGSTDMWLVAVADKQAAGEPELVKKDLSGAALGFTRAGAFFYGTTNLVRDVHVAEMDTESGRLVTPLQPVSSRWIGITRSPDWSPDGKFLAYVRNPAPHESVIVIRSTSTGEERDLVMGKLRVGLRLRWAPDSKAVVVSGFESGKSWNLVQVDVQSGRVTPLMPLPLNGAFPRYDLSPDGKTVFHIELPNAPNTTGIRLMARDLASGRETEVAQKEQLVWISVSPDGRRLLMGAQEDKSLVWRIMSVTGGEARLLVRIDAEEANYRTGALWTADGRDVVFTKGQRGRATRNVQLWRIPAEGGEPQRLGLTVDELWWLSLHPDGRRVAVGTSQASAEIWVMENFLPKAGASSTAKVK